MLLLFHIRASFSSPSSSSSSSFTSHRCHIRNSERQQTRTCHKACHCWDDSTKMPREFPRQPQQTEATLREDLERLRRRVRENEGIPEDSGPEFLKAPGLTCFDHMVTCTACGIHREAKRQARGVGDSILRDFGTRWQSFYDDWVIESSCNLRRHQAKPWKPRGGSVLKRYFDEAFTKVNRC